MAFYYLLLGHLLGDFVLQTDRIAENKGKHRQWNILHVLVVTLCTAALSYQFGLLLIALVFINGLIHYFLDYYKQGISKILHLPDIVGFLLDQSAHISLIYLISFFAVYTNSNHIIDLLSTQYMVVLILVTSFSAILNQFAFISIFPRCSGRFFEEREKQLGILSRILLAVIFYLLIFVSKYFVLLFVFFITAIFFVHIKLKSFKWLTLRQLSTKLLLDSMAAAIGILIIYFIK